ncbi:hypothetical protein B7R75_19680 [Yersinia pseudotuberculosis]|nr:hypothetical protein B7R75_19680 [Yersinia pseudotuberculosis]
MFSYGLSLLPAAFGFAPIIPNRRIFALSLECGSSHNLLGIVVPPVFSTTANESLRPVLFRLPPSCNSNDFGYKLIEIGIDKSVAQISANQAV